MPTVGELFAGIGGIGLGLERAGFTIAWQVELDPFCRRVLAKHWPDVRRWDDVRTFPPPDGDWRVDLVCGGFPCQPVSVAGKRRAQADERWLWPEFARVVRVLRPRVVLVENVPGLFSRGMGDVLGDLAACGYDAEWDCIPASAVGAPHRRDRVWIVAYASDAGQRLQPVGEFRGRDSAGAPDDGTPCALAYAEGMPDGLRDPCSAERQVPEPGIGGRQGDVADTPINGRGSRRPGDAEEESRGREPRGGCLSPDGMGYSDSASAHALSPFGGPRPAASESSWWRVEPDVGRVAHGVPARVDRLRGLGNAVVPQVAEWIGRRLMAMMTDLPTP